MCFLSHPLLFDFLGIKEYIIIVSSYGDRLYTS